MRSKYAPFIDHLVRRWLSSGACQVEIKGCSQAEIEEIRVRQAVKRLPAVYVEWLKQLGRETGTGYYMDYPYILESKKHAYQRLQTPDTLVFVYDAESDYALYCSVLEDDPIVYWTGYDAKPDPVRGVVTTEMVRLSTRLSSSLEIAMEIYKRTQGNNL